MVERKSRQVVIQKVERATAEQTAAAITRRLGAVAEQVATITFDNGKEFAYHKQIAEALGCEAYFARPYHSWERGTNENMNGLIRQYFRPRKRLGYRAPIEVFCEGLHRQGGVSGGVAVIG